MFTYCAFGLWVLNVHIKRREENRVLAKLRLPSALHELDDDVENVFVFGLWPWIVCKWWFG